MRKAANNVPIHFFILVAEHLMRAPPQNSLSGTIRYHIRRETIQMGANREQLLYLSKYLLPKNNLWLKRAFILFGFILLDYLATLIFINTPAQEGNLLVRAFMEDYGIILGLTIFDILINIPIYLIICLNSHFVALPSPLSKVVNPIIDVFLAWFVAGYHYSGATSWFWASPDMVRQTVGFSIYLLIYFIASQASNMQQTFLCKQEPSLQ
ncbi:MAG: hypothetical protein PVI43_02770 [Candidatus Bathyarchaeota archaeon]|jgi:hypothetical protein